MALPISSADFNLTYETYGFGFGGDAFSVNRNAKVSRFGVYRHFGNRLRCYPERAKVRI